MTTAARPAVTGQTQLDAWRRRALPPVEAVRPELWSVPVPIPDSPLRYTLAYAYVGDAVVLVDPGWDSPEGRRALAGGLAVAGAGLADVAGVVVTHVHPDHHGLTGWVAAESDAWIAMHPAEAETLPARLRTRGFFDGDRERLARHGVPDDEVDLILIGRGQVDSFAAMPAPTRFLDDGDPVPDTGRDVRAVWTPGHTPGHLCLYDAAAGALLTGDHLLPRISPNIGVHGGEGDPLGAYLASLERTAAFDAAGPDRVEALPAHEYRFTGVAARAAELARHHGERGTEVLGVIDALGDPTAWAVAAELTWSRGWPSLHGMMRRMALAETVAHLHQLRAAGVVAATGDAPRRWRAVR